MRKFFMVAFIISIVNKSAGQLNEDIFSFNYSLAPIGNDDIDFSKVDFGISIPVKLKEGLLINSFKADFYSLNYGTSYSFSTTDISKFNGLNYGLKYIYPLSNTWKLNAQVIAALVSNSLSHISYNDLFVGGDVSVTKLLSTNDTSESLTLGVNYTTITGEPRFLPTINYAKQVNDKLSYGIGFPKTYVVYKLSELGTLKSLLSLDGFYSNLSTPISVNLTDQASKASFSSTSLALEYDYEMDDNWGILLRGGYSFTNKYTLLDSGDNKIFDFNTVSKPIFSAGIKFNIKKANKK
ncbi:DUF6268 family outer membrane beta-barrel protein [Flavivirga aquimarina]|uniref:DUF6268 family outer membrane beta-barrel protein n=1 Tax=Flavivirga aquimarina TaxID=2027862 RepID=A0ABT8W8I9_9FLAO|nr:DUF6268 family outer membrane beta-barrel protein [Flavivirga aquimarina]MDO5969420.1 DUF6268 family outer membrane beta-barrel protein [Flavivirga aquimarina]